MISVVVSGAMGRMGELLVRLIREEPSLVLAAAVERADHADLGTPVAGVTLRADLEASLEGADVLIDFSAPDATARAATAAAGARVPAVFGTTGLEPTQRAAIHAASHHIPIVFAPNMSVGVTVATRLVSEAARLLGDRFSPAVFEAHHRWKKDSPSGTALALAEAAHAPKEAIAAIRGGDVVGEHTVFFFGDGERVEITHRATSREAFACGALRAATWVVGRAPGLYDMAHVLGISTATNQAPS